MDEGWGVWKEPQHHLYLRLDASKKEVMFGVAKTYVKDWVGRNVP